MEQWKVPEGPYSRELPGISECKHPSGMDGPVGWNRLIDSIATLCQVIELSQETNPASQKCPVHSLD